MGGRRQSATEPTVDTFADKAAAEFTVRPELYRPHRGCGRLQSACTPILVSGRAFLVERVMAFDLHKHWQKTGELLQNSIPFAVVTLVDMRGSAPQVQGAKAIITAEGIVEGTVGGGKVEARAIAHAQEMLRSHRGKHCELVTWNLQTDIGMTCGGEVKFYFEVYLCHDWKIVVFGAGHVAQALIPILLQMHCRVTCVDQRSTWLAKLPDDLKLTKIQCDHLPEALKELDAHSFFVLMTQGHATDLPILARILQTMEPPYVGVLGSLQKAKVLERNLKEMGLTEQQRSGYFCPMGLSIGNNTPAEIAISIVAQLIQRRDQLGILHHKTKMF